MSLSVVSAELKYLKKRRSAGAITKLTRTLDHLSEYDINDFAHVEIEKLKQTAEQAFLSYEEVYDALDTLALDDAYVTKICQTLLWAVRTAT